MKQALIAEGHLQEDGDVLPFRHQVSRLQVIQIDSAVRYNPSTSRLSTIDKDTIRDACEQFKHCLLVLLTVLAQWKI